MTKIYTFTVRAHKNRDLSDKPEIRTWQFVAANDEQAQNRAQSERARVNALAILGARSRFIGIVSLES